MAPGAREGRLLGPGLQVGEEAPEAASSSGSEGLEIPTPL